MKITLLKEIFSILLYKFIPIANNAVGVAALDNISKKLNKISFNCILKSLYKKLII